MQDTRKGSGECSLSLRQEEAPPISAIGIAEIPFALRRTMSTFLCRAKNLPRVATCCARDFGAAGAGIVRCVLRSAARRLGSLGPWPRHPQRCGPPESRPFSLCPCQPGHDTFADHRALKLGKHAEHLKHRAAGRCGRVEPLLMQIQIDTFSVQFLQHPQILQAAAQPVDGPCRDHVDLLPGDRLEQLVEAGRRPVPWHR